MKSPAPSPALVLVTLGLGALMATLDGSVVNVSLPVIRRALSASLPGAQWVVASYLLVMSALLLTFGRLGDLLGHRRVYLAGFFVFGSASLLCAAAPHLPALVAGRALQAVGAAALQSVAPALLTSVFPAQRRGRALGLLSVFTYLGLTIGPSVGGALTAAFGWRSVFLVNLPVAAAALWLGTRVLPARPRSRAVRFDLAGAALWGVGLTALLLGTTAAGKGGLPGIPTFAPFALAAVLLLAFGLVERRREAPMIDLALFRSPELSFGVAAAFLNYVALYSITFLTPFRLIDGAGLTPGRAGLLLTVMPVAMAALAPLSGALSDRIGTRGPAATGMVLLAAAVVLLREASAGGHLVLGLLLAGAGTGIFISPNTSAVLGAAPAHRQGITSGVVATARTTGMVAGVALAGSLYALALGSHGPGHAAYATALWPALVASALAALGSLARTKRSRGA